MDIVISDTKQEAGRRAAEAGAVVIRRTIREQGAANIVLATGASQFEMLAKLVTEEIDWSVVTAFHLDEYAAMPVSHPASFRRYLQERFVEKLPKPLRAFHWINGEGDLEAECRRLGAIIARHPIAVAFIGIGENGHLAFNDPPADFETEAPYIVVSLDEACRRQQLGEGWFATLEDVPQHAISMSIRQILKSERIVCTVPDRRKAQAVQAAVEGPISPQLPASILRQHPRTTLFLDHDSASLLERHPSSGS